MEENHFRKLSISRSDVHLTTITSFGSTAAQTLKNVGRARASRTAGLFFRLKLETRIFFTHPYSTEVMMPGAYECGTGNALPKYYLPFKILSPLAHF
jgi:hypothetical protein